MRLRTVFEFLKIEHSLFALPFVLGGVLFGLSREGRLVLSVSNTTVLLLVFVAAIGARTLAMTLNRIVDEDIDRNNPRTANRALAVGLVSRRAAWALAAAAAMALLGAATLLNPLCLALSPLLVVLFVAYPYSKRYTYACHFVLGLSLAAAPVGGYLAVTGSFDGAAPVLALAAFCLLWVAGFDIIYALLDIDVDRAQGLKSVPAHFGASEALVFSSALHVVMLVPLAVVGLFYVPLSIAFFAALVAIVALLSYEHKIADPKNPVAINRAFFAVNAALGWIVLGGIGGALLGY